MLTKKTLLLLQSIPVYPAWKHIDIKTSLNLACDIPLCESDTGQISFISEKLKEEYLEKEIAKMERRKK